MRLDDIKARVAAAEAPDEEWVTEITVQGPRDHRPRVAGDHHRPRHGLVNGVPGGAGMTWRHVAREDDGACSVPVVTLPRRRSGFPCRCAMPWPYYPSDVKVRDPKPIRCTCGHSIEPVR